MQHPLPDRLILFDIDGTLILTGGAGQRAMTRAFADVFGVANALEGIEMAGRMDSSILADASSRWSVSLDEAAMAAFRSRYLDCLREEVPQAGRGQRVLPGIAPLLEALAPRPTLLLGLLTGNFADAAEVKLGHFDLWRYFRCGAFGDDAHDRDHLVPIALGRAHACGLSPACTAEHVVVIGDTPRDVACARAHGARVIAVATGVFSHGALIDAGADAVFHDLTDTQAVLAVL